MDTAELKLKFLNHFEDAICEYDFSILALRAMEAKLDLDYHTSDLVFEGGFAEILTNYNDLHNEKLLETLNNLDISDKSFRDKISLAIFLKLTSQKKDFVKKTSSFYLKPSNLKLGLEHSWANADKIWNWAGDKSINYNFYSKRLILEGIYLYCLRFYIKDNSTDNIDTKNFIDNSVYKTVDGLSKIKNFKFSQLPILRYFL
jgi:ubiquinone biosynthesis protein COQ9